MSEVPSGSCLTSPRSSTCVRDRYLAPYCFEGNVAHKSVKARFWPLSHTLSHARSRLRALSHTHAHIHSLSLSHTLTHTLSLALFLSLSNTRTHALSRSLSLSCVGAHFGILGAAFHYAARRP